LDISQLISADFNFYSFCNLNKNVIENTDLYYLSIAVIDSKNKGVYSFIGGNGIFKTQCEYQKEEKTEKNFAKCSFKNIPIMDKKTGEQYSISIIAASNQK
jgi:hypothetical protein